MEEGDRDEPSTEVLEFIFKGDGLGHSDTIYGIHEYSHTLGEEKERILGDFRPAIRLLHDDVAPCNPFQLH